MLLEHSTEMFDDLRAEPQYQNRKYEEADKPTGEDGNHEVAELHLEDRGAQYKHLEWHGRGKHGWKHQRPEFVALERLIDLQKALYRYALAQDLFASKVSNDVQRNAAHG